MEEMNQLVNLLNKYNEEYYTNDNPSISDNQYDKLYDKLVNLEKETETVLPNSPTVKVGGQTLDKFEKVQHKNKLWSLDKAQSFDELKDWIKRCETFVKDYNKTHTNKLPQLQYLVLKKFDGLTLKCDYVNIDLIQGSTRGTGTEGEKVTEQCKALINLPLQLKDNSKQTTLLSAHGEGLMTKKGFEEYNKTAKKPLKNLRNGTAGAIRNLDPKETAKRKPIIYFYNINDIEGVEFQTYKQQLEYMKYRGLPVAEYTVCNTYEEIVQAINNIEKERLDLSFDIDGAVIAINDLVTRNLMGCTEKFPKYSLAYKYKALETTTKLLDVEWNVSRYGRVNPTGILDPVDLCGSTVGRATLNNIEDIERKGVKLNSRVFLRKSNDVIPEITGVVDESLKNEDIKDIEIPKECPCCKSLTEIRKDNETRYLYCTNENCPDKIIKALTHYASREAMNIEGLSIETIKLFIKHGIIKQIKDIYNLEQYKQQIINLPKFGIKKYNNLIQAIEKSKNCKLSSFLFALGIDGVGKKASKDICDHFNNDLDMIMVVGTHEYMKIDGIGDTIANSIVDYFNPARTIRKTNEIISYLTFIEDKPKEVKQGVFTGKSLYCTGTFSCGKKGYLQELVESNGGTFTNGITKDLTYLVVGSLKGSGKEKQARDKGIEVLQEDEFLQIVKGN